jgi:ADP-ribose pyrophosphatase YjhB (NUDIX family)
MIGQRLSAGGIVVHKGKVALVHLYREGQYDFWVLPGGGIEEDEGILRAAERETWEETSLKVRAEKIAYVEEFIDEGQYVCKFWVYCRLEEGKISIGNKSTNEDYLKDAGFFTRDELQEMQVFPSILKDAFWDDFEAGFPTVKYLGYRHDTD